MTGNKKYRNKCGDNYYSTDKTNMKLPRIIGALSVVWTIFHHTEGNLIKLEVGEIIL